MKQRRLPDSFFQLPQSNGLEAGHHAHAHHGHHGAHAHNSATTAAAAAVAAAASGSSAYADLCSDQFQQQVINEWWSQAQSGYSAVNRSAVNQPYGYPRFHQPQQYWASHLAASARVKGEIGGDYHAALSSAAGFHHPAASAGSAGAADFSSHVNQYGSSAAMASAVHSYNMTGKFAIAPITIN
jgi:hypothetical protein